MPDHQAVPDYRPRILPAGAMSGRYLRLFKIAGYPNDYFFEQDQAKAAADARGIDHSQIYGVNFYER